MTLPIWITCTDTAVVRHGDIPALSQDGTASRALSPVWASRQWHLQATLYMNRCSLLHHMDTGMDMGKDTTRGGKDVGGQEKMCTAHGRGVHGANETTTVLYQNSEEGMSSSMSLSNMTGKLGVKIASCQYCFTSSTYTMCRAVKSSCKQGLSSWFALTGSERDCRHQNCVSHRHVCRRHGYGVTHDLDNEKLRKELTSTEVIWGII